MVHIARVRYGANWKPGRKRAFRNGKVTNSICKAWGSAYCKTKDILFFSWSNCWDSFFSANPYLESILVILWKGVAPDVHYGCKGIVIHNIKFRWSCWIRVNNLNDLTVECIVWGIHEVELQNWTLCHAVWDPIVGVGWLHVELNVVSRCRGLVNNKVWRVWSC